jgi:hypothetical protein
LQEEVLLKYLYNPATDSFEALEPTMRDRFALGGGVIQGEKVNGRVNLFKGTDGKIYADLPFNLLPVDGSPIFVKDSFKITETTGLSPNGNNLLTNFNNIIDYYNNRSIPTPNLRTIFDQAGGEKYTKEAGVKYKAYDKFVSQSERKFKGFKIARDKFIPFEQKVNNYINNVMLDPNTDWRTVSPPKKHLAEKFGVDRTTITNNASKIPAFEQNKKLFSFLRSNPFIQRFKSGDRLKTIEDVIDYVDARPPSGSLGFSKNTFDKFILDSAYRNYNASIKQGVEPKVRFIGNPNFQNPKDWKFVYKGQTFSGNPDVDFLTDREIRKNALPDSAKKINALSIDSSLAKKQYGKIFPSVFKAFEDLETYKNTKIGNKKLDYLIKQEKFKNDPRPNKEKKYKLIKSDVEVDHKLGVIDSPFDNIRVIDTDTNRAAGVIQRQFLNNQIDEATRNKKLSDIGYDKDYKDINEFIENRKKSLNLTQPKTKGLAKKGLKSVAKALPLVGTAIGLYDVGQAVKAGIRDPRDLYTAYEVSPEIAAKQKAIREDPTGKLLKEEIANLPEITTDDQVAGLLEESGSPYMQFLQDGGQLSFEEFQKMQSIPQSDRPLTGELDLPEMDQTMMAAQGGRVGFKDGTPNPVIQELLSGLNNTEVMDNILKNNTPGLEESMFGTKEESNLLQRLNQTLDPRAFPYYAAQITKGVALAPEFAARLTLAAPKALADLAQGKSGVGAEFAENIEPKVTQKQVIEKFGLQKILDDMDQDITGSQRTVGDLLKLAGESVGPATGVGYFASAGKAANQIRKELQKYTGTASAAKELEKSVEEKASSLQMTRREFNSLLAGGGIIGLVKALGLDTIFPAAKTVAQKAAPEIITKGGTPKYFFDFVNLIKTKGDDITETAATVERQKVYDYNGYTMYEDMTTGKISIRKDTEGGATYSIGDGEYETVDGIIRKEEINYEPSETILNEKGKPVKVPDQYDEATVRPDEDGGEGDFEAGLDSIDDILELLSKDGKTYSKEELLKMGIDADALGNYPTGAGSIPEGSAGDVNPFKPKKAGGGIIKLAGDDSGPPPKSGPTPHGLPYVAKNVRPIKERK